MSTRLSEAERRSANEAFAFWKSKMELACQRRDCDELKRIASDSNSTNTIATIGEMIGKNGAAESVLYDLYSQPFEHKEGMLKIFETITTFKSLFLPPAKIEHLNNLFRSDKCIADENLPAAVSFTDKLIRELAAAGKLGDKVNVVSVDVDDGNILDRLLTNLSKPSAFYRLPIIQLLLAHRPSLLNADNTLTTIREVATCCTFRGDQFEILETLLLTAYVQTGQPMLTQSEMEKIFRTAFVSAAKSQRFHQCDVGTSSLTNLNNLVDLFVTKCGINPNSLLVDGRVLFGLAKEEQKLFNLSAGDGGYIPLTIYYRHLLELGLDPNSKVLRLNLRTLQEAKEEEFLFHRLIAYHESVVLLFLEYGADEKTNFEQILRTNFRHSYEPKMVELVAEMNSLFSQGLELRAARKLRCITAVSDVCGGHYSYPGVASNSSGFCSNNNDSNNNVTATSATASTIATSCTTVVGLLPPMIELVVDYCQNFAAKVKVQ